MTISRNIRGARKQKLICVRNDTSNKKKKPKIKDVKVGMVFRVRSKDCNVTNYARVTKRPSFNKKGDRPDIFYAVLVNPKNFRKKRLSSDREFAVWDFNYKRGWSRVK